MRIEHKEKCRYCNGTGLYKGLAERDEFAVVCRKCDGTGCFEFVHEYEPFAKRAERQDVQRVIQANPGIVAGTGNGHSLLSFGGMPYQEWVAGKPFPAKSEMRNFVCPAWWYQSADYSRKPDWKECGSGAFSSCKYFCVKAKCWERFDAEEAKKCR